MDLVDWDLAASTARRLVRPGPVLTRVEAAGAVAQMRELAEEATASVSSYTGLVPDPSLRVSTAVVDRPTWAAGNVAGLRVTLGPVLETLTAKRAGHAKGPGAGAVAAVGRRVTGVEIGGVLAFLSTRVLGQYEVFLPAADGDGRLSLVAPNIVEVERRLAVNARDFRMWVCLHEQTHRLQFTAVPWLKPHLIGLVGEMAEAADLDPQALLGRLREAIRTRDLRDDERVGGPLAVLQTPRQREISRRVQSLMTLLEGHADLVMDAVGPEVVPTVATIRDRFEQRRRHRGSPLDRLLRRLLGLDAKMAQYRVGGQFCRDIVRLADPARLRGVFASPDTLPTAAELTDPASWLARTAGERSSQPAG